MINLYIVLGILFWHWIADFILQTDNQAKLKSSNIDYLLGHTFQYTISWFIPIFIYWGIYGFNNILLAFIPITFICHTFTDYITSRLNKLLWDQKMVHEFFVSIGFDQFLHYLQLLITYYLLAK